MRLVAIVVFALVSDTALAGQTCYTRCHQSYTQNYQDSGGQCETTCSDYGSGQSGGFQR
jgi:hypothetical protein